MAKYESLKPKTRVNIIGTKRINVIPKIKDIIADILANRLTLNSLYPNLRPYHPVIAIDKHIKTTTIPLRLDFSAKSIIKPTIEVRK